MESIASCFELNLLTGFELIRDGKPIEVTSQKVRALLCVLGMQDSKAIQRSSLGSLLWDNMDDDQAKMNLRQTLSVLKKALGTDYPICVEATKQSVRLLHEAIVVDAIDEDIVDQTAALDLNLFAGQGARSRSFELWLSEQQNKIVKASIQRTQKSLSQALNAKRFDEALSFAKRLNAFAPDDPDYAAQVHRLLVSVGHVHEAEIFAKNNLGQFGISPTTKLPDAGPTPTSDAPIILVGRLNYQSDDKSAAMIGLALSEAIVADLSESAWVGVIAPDLTNLSAPLFGMQQNYSSGAGWNYRIDGTIQTNPLHASIWLTNGANQTVVWTEKFRCETVGQLAEDIVSRITSSIEAIVMDVEGRRASQSRTASGYWEKIARARTLFWRASQSANQEAEVLLDQMLEEESHDVRVLTLACYAKLMNAWSGWGGQTAINLDQAARFGRRAIQSAPDDAWSLMTLATVLSARLDLVGAKRKLEQAIAIRPHLAAAKGELARILVFSGQTKSGNLLAAEALDASPRDPHASLWLRTQAISNWIDGNFDQGLMFAQLAIDKRSNWYPNYLVCAAIHAALGDQESANSNIRQAQTLLSNDLSAEALRCGHPFEDRLVFDRFVGDLRKGGWDQA